MSKNYCLVLLVFTLVVGPAAAEAGWRVEWKNTPIHKSGPQDSEIATAYIGANKSRMEQEHLTTIFDYDQARFTVMNPKTKLFWSGTIDEYVRASARRRNEALRTSMGSKRGKDDDLPEIVVEELPEITIERSGEQREIAGHETIKYVVQVNEEQFQELWVAEGLNVAADLSPEKFLEYQRKNSRGMLGGTAKPYNALYRSPAYLDLLKKGFVLETTTHHLAGGFQQTAKSIRQVEVTPSQFAVPEDYRRAQLDDVFKLDLE